MGKLLRTSFLQLALMTAPVWASGTAQPISPGAATVPLVIEDRCPTFLWGLTEQVERIEVAVYKLSSRFQPGGAVDLDYQVSISGRAHGWSPDLERCLERGATYAWAVRVVSGGHGDWSEALLFRVAEAVQYTSTAEEVIDKGRDGETPEAKGGSAPPVARTAPGRSVAVEAVAAPVARRHSDKGPDVSSLTVDSNIHLGPAANVFKDGEQMIADDATYHWTALGRGAMAVATGASSTTAVGWEALASNTTGGSNTAVGSEALSANTNASGNTAIGAGALESNESGSSNTAVGHAALKNKSGNWNTAVGANSLSSNLGGSDNTAVGKDSLLRNSTGSANVAVGRNALRHNGDSAFNVAVGNDALRENVSGWSNVAIGRRALNESLAQYNVAVGSLALSHLSYGSHNVAIGTSAGTDVFDSPVEPSESNVYINSRGVRGDSHTLRIGGGTGTGDQEITSAFIHGIRSGPSDGDMVVIDADGKLGIVVSSARYKEQIRALGDGSRELLNLRPVAFRYRAAGGSDGSPVSYGLIAEEVAQIYPNLVGLDSAGRPETVRYHLLIPLLISETQRQERVLTRLTMALALVSVGFALALIKPRRTDGPIRL